MLRIALAVSLIPLVSLVIPGSGRAGLHAAERGSAEDERHRAFRPLHRPNAPRVERSGWARSPIDPFVLARLEAAGLEPSPPADRRALIRRLTYDLTGLPPEPAEVDAFVADPAPDAYERLVDRLLASPSYGERWGRHWLDVARYADTKDLVLVLGRDAIRPYAYTYRDYVIRALNEDLPYDRFLHEQLAADRIEPPVEPWKLAAMGFLTLGRLFDNNPHDIYDDQIDTVTRGLLGLTVSCARCHDHKYDPIPQEDYYSLYGIFANSVRPIERPRIDARDTQGIREFEKKASALREKLRRHIDEQYGSLRRTARERVADYLRRRSDLHRLDVYRCALELYRRVGQMVAQFPRGEAELRSQMRRASRSVPCEGVGKRGRAGARAYEVALGEAKELIVALDCVEIDQLAPIEDIGGAHQADPQRGFRRRPEHCRGRDNEQAEGRAYGGLPAIAM